MSRSLRALAALTLMFACAASAAATENPPDDYLCYQAGTSPNKKLPKLPGTRTEVQDRFGGPQSFVIRRLSTLCNPAGLDGGTTSHPNVHLVGLVIKKEKTAPKFVPSTLGVVDRFGTHTFALTDVAVVLDVTPVQPGTNAPADFNDDPTTVAVETNRFKCYTAALPKGSPKFAPPAPPAVTDDAYPIPQSFLIKKPSKVCLPADVEGATPGAASRNTLLVCYTAKLAKGGKVVRETVGTRSRTVGVRIVGRRKPVELCVTGRVFPGN